MTANQLQYWRNVETERHNRATEQQALLDYGVSRYDVYENKRLSAESSARQAGAAERNADTNWYSARAKAAVDQWNAQIAQDRQRVDAAVAKTQMAVNTSQAGLNQQRQLTEGAQRQYLTAQSYLDYERRVTEQFNRAWNESIYGSQLAINEAQIAKLIAEAQYAATRADYYGAEATADIVSEYINAAGRISSEVRQWLIPYSGIGQSNNSYHGSNGMYYNGSTWVTD